ncbi:MAG: alternative ribosome rescue aminoacyl-tRNA hydrolase ArfB, partial [Ignavibacteria bacterium]
SQTERTQLGNRKKVIQKFEFVINNALREDKKRVKTTQSISSKLKRLESKRKHSEKKKLRSLKIIE